MFFTHTDVIKKRTNTKHEALVCARSRFSPARVVVALFAGVFALQCEENQACTKSFALSDSVLTYQVQLSAVETCDRVVFSVEIPSEKFSTRCNLEKSRIGYKADDWFPIEPKKYYCLRELASKISELQLKFEENQAQISFKFGVWLTKTLPVTESTCTVTAAAAAAVTEEAPAKQEL